MEKKNCEKGCLGRILNKEKGIYCACIERLLPKYSKQSFKASPANSGIERFSAGVQDTAQHYESILATTLLSVAEQDLVYNRAVSGMSFNSISRVHGWVDARTASRRYSKIMQGLRNERIRFLLEEAING